MKLKVKYQMRFTILSYVLFTSLLVIKAQTNKPTDSQISLPNDSPAMVYKLLYDAVQRKDIETIKRLMSKDSLNFAEIAAKQQKKSSDIVLSNGFLEPNLSPTFPKIRNQRIKGNFAALQVENPHAEKITEEYRKWLDVPFILEDGEWKIAIGDMFEGNYKIPCNIPTKLDLPVLKTAPSTNSSEKRSRNKNLKRRTTPTIPNGGNFCKPSDITQPEI